MLPSNKNNQVLCPQDVMDTLSINYLINDKLRNSDSLKQKVKILIFAENDFELTIEKEMSEILELNEIQSERKLDETVKSGRYIVDGKIVNANGEEIK